MNKIKTFEKEVADFKKEKVKLKKLSKKKEKETLEKKLKKVSPKVKLKNHLSREEEVKVIKEVLRKKGESSSKKNLRTKTTIAPKVSKKVLDNPSIDFTCNQESLKFDEGCAHFRYLNGDPDDLNVDVEAIISKSKKTIKLQWVCVDDTYSNWEGRISEDCKKIALLKSEKYPPSVHINLEWGFSEFERNASCYRGNGVDEAGTRFYIELFLE